MKDFLKAARKFAATASQEQLRNAVAEVERLLDSETLTPENRRLAEKGLMILREELSTQDR